MSKNNNSTGFLIGILAGVAGGIVAGLLIAPKAGSETCKNVREAMQELGEKLSPEVREAKRQAIDVINYSKHRVEKLCKEFSNSVRASKLAKAKSLEIDVYGI